MRRLVWTAAIAGLLFGCNQSASMHKSVLTLDTHVDIPLEYMSAKFDPATNTELQVDFAKMHAGGLDAAFFIVYTPQGDLDNAGYATGRKIAETRFAAIDKMVKTYPSQIELATTAAKVQGLVRGGKLAALIGMENAYPLGGSIEDVSMWAARGVRYMGITHFGHNQFGDSSNINFQRDDGPRHNGLSPLGRELVGALNDHGILVDVSHAGKETMLQAAALSRAPIIASHSGVKAVADSARNLDDEQLRAIAKNGGVAHMVALNVYVKPFTDAQIAFRDTVRAKLGLETEEARNDMSDALRDQYREALEPMYEMKGAASVADFVDHIDHAVKITGIDHVGIASDFDGGGGIKDWQDASKTAAVTKELRRRGYSPADIEKIWSGNLLRILDAAAKQAKP